MAFRFVVSMLFVAAVFGTSSANPRFIREAKAASYPYGAKVQQSQQIQQSQQNQQVYVVSNAAQAKAVPVQSAQYQSAVQAQAAQAQAAQVQAAQVQAAQAQAAQVQADQYQAQVAAAKSFVPVVPVVNSEYQAQVAAAKSYGPVGNSEYQAQVAAGKSYSSVGNSEYQAQAAAAKSYGPIVNSEYQAQVASAKSFFPVNYVQPQGPLGYYHGQGPIGYVQGQHPINYPSPAPALKSGSLVADQQASVIQQSYDFNPVDSSYSYSYQTDNGITNQAQGSFNKEGKYVVQGSYTLYTKEGYPVSISYVADENGFNAVGDAIPQPDPAIVKAVEYLRSLPPQKDEQ